MVFTSPLHEYRPDQLAHPILLIVLLLVEHQNRAEFFPGVEDVLLICYIFAQQPLHLICYTFAQLVIFVYIFVVLRQSCIGFRQQIDPRLQLENMLSHAFVVVGHCAEFQGLVGQLLAGYF